MPVFLPTTLQGAEQIVQTISELKNKVPSDPLEADLITMAEVIAEDQKPGALKSGFNLQVERLLVREVTNGALALVSDSILICAGKREKLKKAAANHDSEDLPFFMLQM